MRWAVIWAFLRSRRGAQMGLAMVGTGGFIVGLVIAFREGAATEVIGASAALLILAFLDNRWESIRGRVGNVEFEVMARALQQSEERVESVESEVEALSEQPDLPGPILRASGDSLQPDEGSARDPQRPCRNPRVR